MIKGAGQKIEQVVKVWEGLEVHPHRFGRREFRLGTREIGHVHGDRLVDIPFPIKVRDELVDAGAAERHHVLPESGWISFYLREDGDVTRAVALLEHSYTLAQQKARRTQRAKTQQEELKTTGGTL